jgi:selenide,water dikinase
LQLEYAALPKLPRAEELAAAGAICGGTRRNLEFYSPHVDFTDLSDAVRIVSCDAQTSGGLLVALPAAEADAFAAQINAMQAEYYPGANEWAAVIGRLVASSTARISIT